MYQKFADWVDDVLLSELPEDGVGVCFNLYEEENDQWAVQFVVTEEFDENDDDWVCEEIFSTEENNLEWQQTGSWEKILEEVQEYVQRYLDEGENAQILRQFEAVGVGFVDGDLKVIYKRS